MGDVDGGSIPSGRGCHTGQGLSGRSSGTLVVARGIGEAVDIVLDFSGSAPQGPDRPLVSAGT